METQKGSVFGSALASLGSCLRHESKWRHKAKAVSYTALPNCLAEPGVALTGPGRGGVPAWTAGAGEVAAGEAGGRTGDSGDDSRASSALPVPGGLREPPGTPVLQGTGPSSPSIANGPGGGRNALRRNAPGFEKVGPRRERR